MTGIPYDEDQMLADLDRQGVNPLRARRGNRLTGCGPNDRKRFIESDSRAIVATTVPMQEPEVVRANRSPGVGVRAKAVRPAMPAGGPGRPIFVRSMDIHGEVPGQRPRPILAPDHAAALAIGATNLGWTILRPARLNGDPVTHCGTTRKGAPFRKPDLSVSRQSAADPILHPGTIPSSDFATALASMA